MCGITGKIYLKPGRVTLSELQEMSEIISYRGPDNVGFYISPNKRVGFSHQRLAIIDLTVSGNQPMSFKNRYWITFNGEIYNFMEEKKRLLQFGYKFKSGTDTEVILALYDKYGVNCLKYLRGMFAFAIYDEVKNTVFIGRDRLGKKPVRYYTDGKVFYFASELKAFLGRPEVKKKPDWVGINHYLTFGYVPEDLTGFEGIKKLEPAHCLLIDVNKGTIEKHRYWDLDFSHKLDLSDAEWSKLILKELEESVKLRMISDVPLGAFLSGGVDSSAVVAMMAKQSIKPVRTFTIVFKETSHNESRYANIISRRYHTEHTELPVEEESVEILPELVKHFETPFSDVSLIITYLISEMAKKYVTVALNGDGGDESFGGYPRYNRFNRDVYLEKFKFIYPPLRELIDLGSEFSQLSILKRASRFLHKAQSSLSDRYSTYNCYFTNIDKESLMSPYFKNKTPGVNSYSIVQAYFDACQSEDVRDKALYMDISSYLSQHLLSKVDLAGMKVSLEGRSPFVDHKFLELTAKIPFDLKVRGLTETKYLFKKTLENLVPHNNLYRKKMGFTPPMSKWFSGNLNAYTKSKLLSPQAHTRKLFDQKYIKYLLDNHTDTNDMGLKLWNLLCLELWFQAYF